MIVTIARNPLGSLDNNNDYQTFENVDNVCALLYREFDGVWPSTAHIYLDSVSDDCDVTPHHDIPGSIEHLQQLDGHFFVIVYPADPITIIGIIAIVIAVSSIALTFLLRPNTNKQNQQQSPNNALANRQNTARPNERIPDIYGTLRITPDLLNPPYRVFQSQQEIEYCFMCCGRRGFEFYSTNVDASGATLATPLWDIKDDLTPVQEEAGASVEVWAPFTSPNAYTGATQTYTPQVRIGEAINSPAYVVQSSSSVIGQILRPPNDQSLTGKYYADHTGFVTCTSTDTANQTVDLTNYFDIGDQVSFDMNPATDPGNSGHTTNLLGTYEAIAVETDKITFANPQAVQAGWNTLASFTGGVSTTVDATLASHGSKWIGPFVLNVGTMTEVWLNFVAPQGLFKVSSSSGNQYQIDCNVLIGIQAVDGRLQPVGTEIFFSGTLSGSAVLQTQRGVTVKCVLPFAGPCQVRVMRTNFTDNTWQGTNADQTQWRDLYAVSPPSADNYGNVTTVQTKTYATASALTSKSRKLNMKVTSVHPIYWTGTTFNANTTNIIPTTNAADLIVAMAIDPYIGNRSFTEIDFASIYATLGTGPFAVAGGNQLYFGTDLTQQFAYTFDDTNTSFEEMLSDLQQATFCTIFRRGNVLSCAPEVPTNTSTLLFNHRNKIPGSEKRTVSFGWTNNYDGIELDYVEPNYPNYPDADTPTTLYFPSDQSAVNPKKVTAVGVHNNVQAYMLGWRLYNKLRYQYETAEFTCTKEAALSVLNDRILVADNTRDDVLDGDVVDVNGLVLTLSQPAAITGSTAYSIYLQNKSGTVATIPITQVPGGPANQVTLAYAPPEALSIDRGNWAQTTYMIAMPPDVALGSNQVPGAMLLAEKTSKDAQQYAIKAINYDARYYKNDGDFVAGIVQAYGTSAESYPGYPAPAPDPTPDPPDPYDPDPGPREDQTNMRNAQVAQTL